MAQLWKEAGDAFVRAAQIKGQDADAKHDQASQYAEAGNCFRKTHPQLAVECIQKTADIYTDMGRFTMAAKQHEKIAELYEKELPDTEKCVHHYQKAADYYKGEESKSSASKCLLKVAMIAAQMENYEVAIKTFEEIALWESEHPTLKYAAKGHFFQALLCHLNYDLLNTALAIKRYEDASPSFSDARECKLVKDLVAALEAEDEDAFTAAVASYDKISKLDPWHTSLLVKMKRTISREEGDDLR